MAVPDGDRAGGGNLMAAGQGSDIYVDIRDFTRGIASSRHSLGGAQPAPENVESASVFAQENDTWGCYGHPAGGLHPLPGVVLEIADPGDDWPTDPLPGAATVATIPANPAHPNYTDEKSLVVNATAVVSAAPRLDPGGETGYSTTQWRKNVRQTPDQLHILYGGYGRADGNSTSEWFQGTFEWRVFNMGRFPIETTGLLGGHDANDDLQDSLGVRREITNVRLDRLGFDDDDIWGDHFMSMGMTSANLVVATTGTYESPGGAVSMDGDITEIGNTGVVALCTRLGIWPRIVGKNSGAAKDVDEDAIETYVIDPTSVTGPIPGSPIRQGLVHQGRIVFTVQSRNGEATSQGLGTYAYSTPGDNICHFAANDLYSEPTTNQYRFMPENPGPIGVMASMNANELIAIKHQGGGGLLRGDVSKPQFVSLPGLPSIQGATNIPAVTSMGLVFGTRDGVFVWQGSEGAESISQQLDGWFWQPEGTPGLEDGFLYAEYPHRGKFNVSGYFVYAPNNWVYDMRTGGWFRLNPTTQTVTVDETDTTYNVGYRNYEVSTTGRVYAVKPLITESDLTVAHLYDRDVPTSVYRWRSQPIARTIARRVDVREVVAVLQGQGTVTITVIGINGQEDAVEFTIDSPDQPRVFRKSVKVVSEDIEVQIDSQATGTITYTDDGVPYAIEGSPAPTVYRMSLGMHAGPSVASDATLTRTPAA